MELSSFTSPKGKELFKSALLKGDANIYFSLSGNFTMQSEPAFCGLGSLAMVLNALSVDPGKRWKGVWRWFSDEMLDCCAPLDSIKSHGLTFQQLAATARGNGLEVVAKQADHISYNEFIEDLKRVTRSEDEHMIVSFSRKTLGQTGDGHFSPIGAYEAEANQVLVMDTARFKYPSYFVDGKLLFDAMFPLDNVSGLPRGYLLLTKGKSKPLPLCRISAQSVRWEFLTNLFWSKLPSLLHKETKFVDAITIVLESIPHRYHFFTSIEADGFDLAGSKEKNCELTTDLRNEVNLLLEETKNHKMYEYVKQVPMDCTRCDNEVRLAKSSDLHALATLFLLSIPRELLFRLAPDIVRQLFQMRTESSMQGLPLLREEVERMTIQWSTMLSANCPCGMKDCAKSPK
jgi:glutathione gamma-glutamylcysteinyltransferase